MLATPENNRNEIKELSERVQTLTDNCEELVGVVETLLARIEKLEAKHDSP